MERINIQCLFFTLAAFFFMNAYSKSNNTPAAVSEKFTIGQITSTVQSTYRTNGGEEI